MPTPINAPLPESRITEIREFIFAFIIVAVVFGAGGLILSKGNEVATLPELQNQANVLNAVSQNY